LSLLIGLAEGLRQSSPLPRQRIGALRSLGKQFGWDLLPGRDAKRPVQGTGVLDGTLHPFLCHCQAFGLFAMRIGKADDSLARFNCSGVSSYCAFLSRVAVSSFFASGRFSFSAQAIARLFVGIFASITSLGNFYLGGFGRIELPLEVLPGFRPVMPDDVAVVDLTKTDVLVIFTDRHGKADERGFILRWTAPRHG
jgi:hypothetical protein